MKFAKGLGGLPIERELLLKSSVSALVGGFLGFVSCVIVNCTLVEISLSSFFSMYFGCLFLSVGGVILWRISSQVACTSDSMLRRKQLMIFSILILMSGFACFFIDRGFFLRLPSIFKIPVYTLLGVSVSFALVFTIVDIVNIAFGFLQHQAASPLVESRQQVLMVLGIALVLGASFGFVFGVMDVEDSALPEIRLALKREQYMCYPIGVLLGAAGGFMNEFLRQQDKGYSRLGGLSGGLEFDVDI
eukprot:GDKH01005398.1.p1 GENE.GDKH01005398.1~~GDKH01005398.1.p1  ORF type:complete len:246 (+),score=33.37 GDKH01005398.1:199-936(+)